MLRSFPGISPPPRLLADAPLFLGKTPSVKNVVAAGLHLQTMAWTWFELGKSLFTSALQIPTPSHSQARHQGTCVFKKQPHVLRGRHGESWAYR